MSKVFISYRRDDSQDAAGRIRDRLVNELGSDSVFIDVDNIPPGANFSDHLKARVEQCDVLLAIIGPDWLNSTDEMGNRRIDQTDDFVRIEIELALQQTRTNVIPVLLHRTRMPAANELPTSLQKLSLRNAVEVEHKSFQRDLELLLTTLKANQSAPTPKPPPALPPSPPGSNPIAKVVTPTPAPGQESPTARNPIAKRRSKPPKLTPIAANDSVPARGVPPPTNRERSDSWQLYLAVIVAIVATFLVVGLLLSWLNNGSNPSKLRSRQEIVPLPQSR